VDVKNILMTSFDDTYKLNQKDNALNSDIFKAKLTTNIFKEYSPELYEINVIGVNENNKRERGEWLLDGFIVKTNFFKINNVENLRVKLGGLWAIESELSVSNKAFITDFSKLLCVRSENYLYVNGINQRTKKGRKHYIENRIKSVKEILDATIGPYNNNYNLYYSFCPTTSIVAYDSTFWELYKTKKIGFLDMASAETLLDLIHIYKFEYCSITKQYIYNEI